MSYMMGVRFEMMAGETDRGGREKREPPHPQPHSVLLARAPRELMCSRLRNCGNFLRVFLTKRCFQLLRVPPLFFKLASQMVGLNQLCSIGRFGCGNVAEGCGRTCKPGAIT